MFFLLKTWCYCPVCSAVIRAMPSGNVGIGDGTDVSPSDGLVRYRQISLTVSVDGIRSRSSPGCGPAQKRPVRNRVFRGQRRQCPPAFDDCPQDQAFRLLAIRALSGGCFVQREPGLHRLVVVGSVQRAGLPGCPEAAVRAVHFMRQPQPFPRYDNATRRDDDQCTCPFWRALVWPSPAIALHQRRRGGTRTVRSARVVMPRSRSTRGVPTTVRYSPQSAAAVRAVSVGVRSPARPHPFADRVLQQPTRSIRWRSRANTTSCQRMLPMMPRADSPGALPWAGSGPP